MLNLESPRSPHPHVWLFGGDRRKLRSAGVRTGVFTCGLQYGGFRVLEFLRWKFRVPRAGISGSKEDTSRPLGWPHIPCSIMLCNLLGSISLPRFKERT